MAIRARQVRFYWDRVDAHVHYELNSLPKEAHSAATLLNYTWYHVVLIDMPWGMKTAYINNNLAYGAHYSELK